MSSGRRVFSLPYERDDGIECPECKCWDLRVTRTNRQIGFILRERTCRHCGHRITTTERVVASTSNPP